MRAQLISRASETGVIAEFLEVAANQPVGLLFSGEPGIGKTTLWLAALDDARDRGFTVLSARAAAAESVMAYASLADLMGGVDAGVLNGLPDPQRLGLDRALLKTDTSDVPTDPRTVAAGFLTAVTALAEQRPVVIAIDDLQWLDPSTQQVVAFAARRLRGGVGVLATIRSDATDDAGWLLLPRPDSLTWMTVPPLATTDLRSVLSSRLGRKFNRPTMERIHAISAGNPFYALELARAMTQDQHSTDPPFPDSLADVVRTRLGGLDGDADDGLLATACLGVPTVDLVARAIGATDGHLIELLSEAEQRGVVGFDGNRIRFAHPILTHGIYNAAGPARRRAMHRRLAALLDEPELHARHLALATTITDPATLDALDVAANSARARGAPAAAAELLDLAISLGGATPERQISSASCHFEASNSTRARSLLEAAIGQLGAGSVRAQATALLAIVRMYADSFTEATALLERAVADAGEDLALTVQTLVMLSFTLVNNGHRREAATRSEEAVSKATALGVDQLLSQALGMRTIIGFMAGRGIDSESMQRALELEDPAADIPIAIRPSVQHSLLLAWTGELDRARHQMQRLRRQCDERGAESELTFVAFTSVLIEVWRGNYAEAELIAEHTLEVGRQLDDDFPLFMGLMLQSVVAAYTGDVERTRRGVREAIEASERCGSARLSEWPVLTLGFLELSLGNHEATLTTLAPLLANLATFPDDTEIITAAFLPDAIEAMISLGRLNEAEPLIDLIQHNGTRLDRPWMLAVGARCRALWVAATGDTRSAMHTVELALEHHDRLPMPFERA